MSAAISTISPLRRASAVASASTRATTAVRGSEAAANRDEPVAKAAFPLLQFADHERATLKQLAFLLTTPRMTKRLVNVYRLLESSRSELLQTEGASVAHRGC